MKRFSRCVVLSLVSCLPLVACGNSETATKADNPAKAASSGETAIDPCAVLTADLLQSIVDIGDAQLTFKPGSSTANPSCQASWEVPNAEEVKAASAKAMQAYMTAKVSGEKDLGPMPLPHLEHQVRLTLTWAMRS